MYCKLMMVSLFCLVLPGCLSLAESNQRSENANNAPVVVTRPTTPPPPQSPPAATAQDVRSIVHDETQASSNAITTNQAGLIDGSIAKVAEKVVGMEAAEMNGIKVSLKNQLDATIKLADELKITNTANVELKGKLELQAQIINDMKLQLGSMSAQVAAQIGMNNKTESTSVGRDYVNFLPTSAVNMIVDLAKLFAGIVTAMVGLLSTAVILAYRASAARDRQRAQSEAEERQAAHQTLVDVLASLDPSKAKELQCRIDQVRGLHKPV